MENAITPIRVAGLAGPLLRPLPILFTYARLTAENPHLLPQAVEDEFNGGMTALAETLETLGRQAGLEPATWQPALEQCLEAAGLAGAELAAGLDGFCLRLRELHDAHGKALKKAVEAEPGRYAEIFLRSTRPRTLLLCFTDGRNDQSDRLERKLADRCYYDLQVVEGEWTAEAIGSADMVLFGPHRRPLADSQIRVAGNYGLPFLVLVGGSREERENMALLRTEHLYRRSGHQVLRSPFTPPRLVSTIDALHLRHLAATVKTLPARRRIVATGRRAAERG